MLIFALIYTLKKEYCITNDEISLMKIFILEGGSNNTIINNNNELVSITSKFYKLIKK